MATLSSTAPERADGWPKTSRLLLRALAAGIGGTLTMDVTGAIGRRLGLLHGAPLDAMRRWFGLLVRGRPFTHGIETVPADVALPIPAALLMHYCIGISIAVTFVLLMRVTRRRPGFAGAVAFGVLSNVLPWLFMFPAMGYGFFGQHGPPEYLLFRTSLANHLGYGVGLGLALYGAFAAPRAAT
jgi:hypothetical protein